MGRTEKDEKRSHLKVVVIYGPRSLQSNGYFFSMKRVDLLLKSLLLSMFQFTMEVTGQGAFSSFQAPTSL